MVMAISPVDAVSRLARGARDNYVQALRQGDPLFDEHGINTPLRMSHFLAQALHETGGFTIRRESTDYSAPRLLEIFGVNRHSAAVTPAEAQRLAHHQEDIAERVYGLGNPRKARELGNTQPGDGFLYRGNGVLQTTGRGNHRRMAATCGIDFEGNPDLVTAPEHALKPALQEWTQNDLNAFADRNDIRTITLKINGGLIGLAERQAWFERVWPLLKADGDPAEPWQAGEADDDVKELQHALNDLGADPKLVVDGHYGPATRQAVKNFQASADITADGVAGPVTKAAIKLKLDTVRGA
jgi:putative chitinase